MRLVYAVVLLGIAAGAHAGTTLFRAGDDGYACFRIPAIVQTNAGSLLAFAEGRRDSCSDTGAIDTVLRRSTDGGATWTPLQVVGHDPASTVGNPAPVVDRRNGRIVLTLTKNDKTVRESAIHLGEAPPRTVWMTHSDDDGVTWAPLRDISDQARRDEWRWYATGPGHGLQLADGALLIPCDHSVAADQTQWHSHVILSDDGGASWRIGGIVDGKTNECMAVQFPDGSIYLNARSYRGNNRRLVARSTDGGESWTPAEEDDTLVEPVCQASVLYMEAAGVLLFANPASTRRVAMTLRASLDEGHTWSHALVVHEGPSAYSDLVALDEHTVGILYEKGENSPYEGIVFDRIPLDSLLD